MATTLSGAAVAAVAVTLTATPTASAQGAAPAAPTITATTNGAKVTIDLDDPNSGIEHALTGCSALLVDPLKAAPLLPSLISGTFPPLEDIDPAILAWGPGLPPTTALDRTWTYVTPDLPAGIYLAVGVCVNTLAPGDPGVAFTPVFVGGPLEIGSSVLESGS
ncbi:hypothetical protein [Rhodococcus gannanensis]|uniref:Secreted protein n=1 Tax=Rhodococcus gannanensis TaxID=1960308 RepID=A0ABW4PAG7_9NOCA